MFIVTEYAALNVTSVSADPIESGRQFQAWIVDRRKESAYVRVFV